MPAPRKKRLPTSELNRLWDELISADAKVERLLRLFGSTPEEWALLRDYERGRVRIYERHLDPHEQPSAPDAAWLRHELGTLRGEEA